ncbi:MAG: SMP-30/gluconolactonase/LRE family protein, partial [Blastocatellia bacterium]
MTRYPGQLGGSVVAGWNAPNRLIVGRNVRPGQQIQLAIFGINGPISNPPTNFIWVREARLDFYRVSNVPLALVPSEVNVQIIKNGSAIEAIVGSNPKIFKLAEGFKFTEGPIWVPGNQMTKSHLLFSDPNSNVIWKYTPNGNDVGKLEVFRQQSGYNGADIGEYGQPGSNGLTLDSHGQLTINQHGNRRILLIEKDGGETVLADKFEGKRLNSPNDLVYSSDGTLFFTDPPFGLPKFGDDPRKELPFNGVYSLRKGKLQLLTKELSGPNGIALSPDEKYLYVGNWDEKKKVVMRYEVTADGRLENGKLFFDMTGAPGEDAIDGIKVDRAGNVYV